MAMKANRSAGVGDLFERHVLHMTHAPTPLLKFGKGGRPKFRAFSLSPDLLALTWQSKNKSASKTRVDIKDMKELRYGQRTDKFKKNNRPDLENLSFSIMFVDQWQGGAIESLDLVCRDESEFQMWTTTLATLIEGKTDLTPYLLAVQKRQLELQSSATQDAGKKNKKHKMMKSKDAFKEANDVYAFGWGEWGQNGNVQNSAVDIEVCATPKLLESLLGKHVVQIAQGWSHTAVVLESGELLQYGNRIGTGLSEDYLLPSVTPLSEKVSIVSLSCGAFHTAALTERGHLMTWGSSINGQCGHGDRLDVTEPRYVEDLRNGVNGDGSPLFVVQVACGSSFTAALTDEGSVYTFGAGLHGVLGHNDTHDRDRPTLVKDLAGTDIGKIAAGDCHMFACTARECYAWGWNEAAQCGLGHEEDQLRPAVIESLRGSEVKEIAAGATHSVAIVYMVKMNVDILFSMGSNAVGQCGQGKRLKVLRPTPVPELRNASSDSPIVEVRCGAFHTLIRSSNGEVYATGSNKYGQCGRDPRQVEQLDEFRAVEFLKDKVARSLCCGGENSSVLTARAWVEDSEATECMACKAPFTFVNRKHHCRNCGGIFCGACSSKKIAILRIQVTEPVRVCNNCYTMLGGR